MRVMGDGSLRADAKAPADWDGVTNAVASFARLGGVSVGVNSRASDRANELHPSVVTAYGSWRHSRNVLWSCFERSRGSEV